MFINFAITSGYLLREEWRPVKTVALHLSQLECGILQYSDQCPTAGFLKVCPCSWSISYVTAEIIETVGKVA